MKIVTIRNFAAISLLVGFMTINNAKAADIAVLDVENIVKNSVVMKDVQSKVAKKQGEYQKEIDKRQAALEAEGKKLEGKKGVMSEEAYGKEQAAFDKKIGDLKDFLEKRQNSLKKASLEAMSKVNDKIRDIITDISKEKKLQLVVPASQTLFYGNEIDISAEVLKRLNTKLTKVDVKFE